MRRQRCSFLLATLGLFTERVWSQGTDLGGGIVTRTNVERYADLPLDIRDIQERLASGDTDTALDIYLEGRNAETAPGAKVSLRSLTTLLSGSLSSNPTPNYLYHLYGLTDRSTNYEELTGQEGYADNFVRSAISAKSNHTGDAINALVLWMYGTHLLYQGVDTCHKLTLADEPGLFNLGGGGMDEFIALWMGQGAGAGSGSGLYTLTQRVGDLFDKTSPEASVNTALKALYQEGSAALSFPNACTRGDDQTIPQLWPIAQRMISQMSVPLMQLLIDALMNEDAELAKMYALAIIPQTAQCRASVYKRLKEELLGAGINFGKKTDILNDLQQVYRCLGFTCADIGTYKVDQLPACKDIAPTYPMAEYVPTTQVHPLAMIDLDILQVKILTSLKAYSFAEYLYSHGRNSPLPTRNSEPYQLRSLKKFATESERETADPFYTLFIEYHDNTFYADVAVTNALQGTGKWGSSSVASRTEVVVKTCAYQIMYMYALTEMMDAIADCESQNPLDNVGGTHSWDEVAAYLIGSLEGPTEGGSPDTDDGQLMWNLANKRAFQFQTENEQGFSKTNSEIEALLFAGKGQLDAFDCVNLRKTVERMQHWLMIPVIQSTLRYAIENEKEAATSTAKSLAEGETFALSVLPIIKSYDEAAATVIEENMIIREGVPPVEGGAQVVADAFYEALDEFGISCTFVGASSQVDACRKEGGYSASMRLHSSAYVLGTLAIAAFMFF